MDDDTRQPDGTVDRLRSGLRALRENGSMLLVVGEAPTGVMQSVCAEMGGQSQATQLIVETGCGCQAPVERDRADLDITTVRWEGDLRGATATNATAGATGTTTCTPAVCVDSMTDLTDAVRRELDPVVEAEPTAGTVRLCLGSPLPLVEAASEETVFRALHFVGALVRRRRGIGHVHLPLERRSQLVRVLEPLFDVTVEVETFGGEPRQRWYLHEQGLASDWLPVGGVGR
jgi:hypothetical protein